MFTALLVLLSSLQLSSCNADPHAVVSEARTGRRNQYGFVSLVSPMIVHSGYLNVFCHLVTDRMNAQTVTAKENHNMGDARLN